jgi:hypothetical protein
MTMITPPLVGMIRHGCHDCNVAPMNILAAEANSASGKKVCELSEDPSTFAFNPMRGTDAIIGAIELRDSGQGGQVLARATCSVENRPSCTLQS